MSNKIPKKIQKRKIKVIKKMVSNNYLNMLRSLRLIEPEPREPSLEDFSL